MGLANNSVLVSFAALPSGRCTPADGNALMTLLNEQVSASVTATGNVSYYNYGASEPTPENRIYPWLKLDGSGFPINWFVYNAGAWREVNPQRIWNSGTSTGAANTYVATTVDTYPSTSGLTVGNVFLVKANVTNTGASTLSINGFTAANIKNGAANTVAGNIVVGVVYAYMWDGTNFNILNPTPTGYPVWVTSSAAGNGTALSGSPAVIATVALNLPSGKTWQHVRLAFSTFVIDGGGATNNGIMDIDVQVGGVSLGLSTNTRGEYTSANHDDNLQVTAIFEGPATGHTTDNPLTLNIVATQATGSSGNGDQTSSRQVLATGIAS